MNTSMYKEKKRREGGVPIDNLDYYFSFPFSSLSLSVRLRQCTTYPLAVLRC